MGEDNRDWNLITAGSTPGEKPIFSETVTLSSDRTGPRGWHGRKSLISQMSLTRRQMLQGMVAVGSGMIRTGEEDTVTGFIRIAKDNWNFSHGEHGTPWHPMGCNYFDPEAGWAPKVWQRFDENRVAAHFAKMQEIGVNAVRIFLSFSSFMPEPGAIPRESMAKCRKLLEIAARHDMRVNFEGPCAWEGTPEWIKALLTDRGEYFANAKWLRELTAFWGRFAGALGDDPTVYAYDLLNEPYMGWDAPSIRKRWNDHLKARFGSEQAMKDAMKGEMPAGSWGDLDVPPNENRLGSPLIWEFQQLRDIIAVDFCKRCAEAIKAVAPRQLVTIGLHPGTVPLDGGTPERYFGFMPHKIAPFLDYIALHWYPYIPGMYPFEAPENFERAMAFQIASLRFCYAGKPVCLEEFGCYGGGTPPVFWGNQLPYVSQEDQARWTLETIERTAASCCSGWLTWSMQDTVEARDPTRYQGFFDEHGRPKELARQYPAVAKKLSGATLRHVPGTETIELNMRELLTSGAKMIEVRDQLIERFMVNPNIDLVQV